jgi:hypothetical protein
MKINLFFDGIHYNIENDNNYIIWIFRNVRGIFGSKANIR